MHYVLCLLCAVLLAGSPADAATVVYCGVVAANRITIGQGSGPRTFELRAAGEGTGDERFGVPDALPLPTIGSYICGRFEQRVPINSLVAYVQPGEPGYVPQ